MPSYIELDKQSSLPSSSNQGKVIFGVNSIGEVVAKDNSGSVINLSTGASSISDLLINYSSVGPKVSFTKTPNGSEIDIIVPEFLEITADDQGIYNIAQEGGFTSEQSPKYTYWNSRFTDSNNYGWDNIGIFEYGYNNQINRFYTNWYASCENLPNSQVLHNDFIMFFDGTELGTDNKYYLIRFTKWTEGDKKIGKDVGFSYDRYEIALTTIFERPNYSPTTVDVITPGYTVLKRDDNGGGLYNEILESSYDQADYQSPLGTEWNSIYTDDILYGFNNLNNVRMRTYGTFRQALNGNVGNNTDTDLVMHDLASDLYYKIDIISWQSGGSGGGVTYKRVLIPENQLFVFPDKTVQRTSGLPTYVINDEQTYYVPEPCILFINNVNPIGAILLPNPTKFNGQKIEVVYKYEEVISASRLQITSYKPLIPSNPGASELSVLSSGIVYEFTSVNGYWYVTKGVGK
jgi:hypothetical protein